MKHLPLTALLLIGTPALAQDENQRFPGYMAFEGRYLAVLSDADMLASAYMDNQLGPRPAGARDELAIVPLVDGLPGEPRRIPVSNAVTAWPTLLALSADGRFAYVAETDQPPGPGDRLREELRPSAVVRVVDVEAGRVIQAVESVGRAQGLSLRRQGDLLAVNIVNTDRPQIGVFRVQGDGRLANFQVLDLPDTPQTPRDVAWSPDGRLIAASFTDDNTTRFYRVSTEGNAATISALGGPVTTGKTPGVVKWSPDGRHLFVTSLHWGGGADEDFVSAQPSTLSVIRVASDGRHRIVSSVPLGSSAENFDISPDGRTIITLNMESSFLTPDSPRLTYHSSLSLLRWDVASERLTSHGLYPFEGILPEGISFDRSGRFLAVANFDHANPQRPADQTTVDFWRLVDGPAPLLVKTDVELPVMRGAHVVLVQP